MSSMFKGNNISLEEYNRIRNFQWSPNRYIDLHKEGVHYFDSDIMPSNMDWRTSITLMRRGLTPPNMLPTYTDSETYRRIKEWYRYTYFRLKNGGVHHLGCETNVQKESEYDSAKIRILLVRLSDYETVDGSTGHYVISEWLRTYCSEPIFIDYACVPPRYDLYRYFKEDIPPLFGSITKRPPCDFDFVGISHSPSLERLSMPLCFLRSGVPLFLWERLSKELPYRGRTPIVFAGGMGVQNIESFIGDNPVHGAGMNSPFDHILIGEGENLDLSYIESYINIVKRDKGSIEDWRNYVPHIRGVYDPTRVLFGYGDKVHIETDPDGKELNRRVFHNGGRIKSIYVIDNDGNKVKVCGEGVRETEDLCSIQPYFLNLMEKMNGTGTSGR